MTLELDWPLKILNWLEVPASTTWRLGLMVGMETFSGAAPSNIRDKIAFSPRVIVSRSNEADNDAPNADVARHASANRTKLRRAETRRSMPVALRLVFSIIDISNRSFLTSQGPARKFHLRPARAAGT